MSVEIAAVQGPVSPLTAQFEDLPANHDGSTPFAFRLVLSDEIDNSDADVRDSAFEVSAGAVTGASRIDGRSDLWEITDHARRDRETSPSCSRRTASAGRRERCARRTAGC